MYYNNIIPFNFLGKSVASVYDKEGHLMGSGIANRQVRTISKYYNLDISVDYCSINKLKKVVEFESNTF